jgi:hypothetical protein
VEKGPKPSDTLPGKIPVGHVGRFFRHALLDSIPGALYGVAGKYALFIYTILGTLYNIDE